MLKITTNTPKTLYHELIYLEHLDAFQLSLIWYELRLYFSTNMLLPALPKMSQAFAHFFLLITMPETVIKVKEKSLTPIELT